MEIPKISIKKVEIHEIPVWKTDVQILNNISKPIVDIPGCVRVHRNNLTSLIDNDIKKYHEELDKKVKKPKIIEKGKFGGDGWSISIGNVEDGNTKN